MVGDDLVLEQKILEMLGMRLADIFVVKFLIHPRLAVAKDSYREEALGLGGHVERVW